MAEIGGARGYNAEDALHFCFAEDFVPNFLAPASLVASAAAEQQGPKIGFFVFDEGGGGTDCAVAAGGGGEVGADEGFLEFGKVGAGDV